MVQNTEPQALNIFGYLIQVVLAFILIWVIKTVQSLTVEVRSIRVALFGMEGDNGINSDVKYLKEEVDRHCDHITECKARTRDT